MSSPTIGRRRFLGAGAAGAAAFLLAGCSEDASTTAPLPGSSASSSAKPTLDGRRLRVAGFANNHAAAPLFWPMFAPDGVEVEVRTLTSGTDMNTALQNGDLDFAVFGIVNGFVEHEKGFDTRIVAMGARQGAGLVVRRDDPAAAVVDLAGRKIGFKGPAFQYLLLLELLSSAGIDPESGVELVPVEWNDMPTALANGDVDAYMGTEPNPSRSVAGGVGRRLVNPYTTEVGQLNAVLWASPAVLDDTDLVSAAVATHRRAAEHLSPGGTNDPQVWRDLIVEQYGLEEPVYAELLTNVGAVWDLDDFWMTQLRAQGARMAGLGIIEAEPDYGTLVNTSFLP